MLSAVIVLFDDARVLSTLADDADGPDGPGGPDGAAVGHACGRSGLCNEACLDREKFMPAANLHLATAFGGLFCWSWSLLSGCVRRRIAPTTVQYRKT